MTGGRPLSDRLGLALPWLRRAMSAGLLRLRPGSPLRRRLLSSAFRRGFAAFNRRDLEAGTQLFDPEVEIRLFGFSLLGLQDRYRGREAFADVFAEWESNMDGLQFQLERIVDLGDRIVARVHVTTSGKASGLPTSTTAGFVYHLSPRGTVARFDDYWDWEEALEAVGLKER